MPHNFIVLQKMTGYDIKLNTKGWGEMTYSLFNSCQGQYDSPER